VLEFVGERQGRLSLMVFEDVADKGPGKTFGGKGADLELQPAKKQKVTCFESKHGNITMEQTEATTAKDVKLDKDDLLPNEQSSNSDAANVDTDPGDRESTQMASTCKKGDNATLTEPTPLSAQHVSILQRFVEGSERRLDAHTGTVLALAECKGRIYSGGKDDAIRVWNKNTLDLEKALDVEHDAAVWSIAAWHDNLISGHDDGKVRIWDLSKGLCEQVLEGHEDGVNALVVCGSRLASGSDDCTVRLWAMSPDARAPWPCERTLEGHRGLVSCLAVWEDKVISGSWDDSIRVSDVATGEHIKTLAGHADTVMALLVQHSSSTAAGPRLISASVDGKVRVWALGGDWAALRTLSVYPAGAGQWVRCLASCGVGLVAGSSGPEDARQRFELQVWDPETLEPRRTVRLPEGQRVLALLGTEEGHVWGGVGEQSVAVWGRE
jgi:hypothetical protein